MRQSPCQTCVCFLNRIAISKLLIDSQQVSIFPPGFQPVNIPTASRRGILGLSGSFSLINSFFKHDDAPSECVSRENRWALKRGVQGGGSPPGGGVRGGNAPPGPKMSNALESVSFCTHPRGVIYFVLACTTTHHPNA